MNLHEAENLALELMIKHNLFNWDFAYHNKKSSFGTCNYTRKTIYLSAQTTPYMDELAVKNTILHEIAHAIVGVEHGHDWVWRKKAIEIGCDGKTAHNYESVIQNMRYKYIAHCPKCNKEYGINRRKKRRSSCNCQGRFFNVNTELHFIQQY